MKKLLLLLFVLTIQMQITAQTTYVPDDNFEQALIDLGYDSGPLDDYVPTANINTLTSLDVNVKSIADLTGIEDFLGLTNLSCYSNILITLNISQNIYLTSLNCANNQLTNLDVSQNTTLTSLGCAQNQLTSLDVSQNTALTSLGCSDNQLTDIDVSHNTALTSLNCAQNQLTDIDVSQHLALIELYCWENQLTNLDVSQNATLTVLHCWENQLTNLDVSQNPDLYRLLCGHNQLTSLDVSNNTALNELGCGFNQLTILDVTQNTGLTSLKCSNNQLISLNVKNGNNTSMITMWAFDNPNLECIQVDDENATSPVCDIPNYLGWCKDETAEYSENCPPIGIEESLTNKEIKIYPNPTQDILNIEAPNLTDKNYTIYNIYGGTSQQGAYTNNQIDISTLTTGIYLLSIDDVIYKIVKL